MDMIQLMERSKEVASREQLAELMQQIYQSSRSGELQDLDHGKLDPLYIEAAGAWLEGCPNMHFPYEPQTAADAYRIVAMCLVAGLVYE